ncbi:uncharacterized protein LOC124286679 [Haliotis rubra]|uniref:uncharacterized protein LOC124286679 n=1 Tax=Haliotis rubra TaxID=36100 RepID=UPI001EE5B197|nr:uncharacterized protein LOC124286679 [Haliotis rubra]
MILSRSDYCNGLLGNVRQDLVTKLQRVQNAAARTITRSRKRSHITSVLVKLHWLPIKARIEYKILCITYRCIKGSAPSYLTNLVKEYVPTRCFRSANNSLLSIPTAKLKTFGHRRFSFTSASLWNDLPFFIKNSGTLSTFQSNLKTFLFRKCHPDA